MECAFAIRPAPSAASAVFFRPLCVLRHRGRCSRDPVKRFSYRPASLLLQPMSGSLSNDRYAQNAAGRRETREDRRLPPCGARRRPTSGSRRGFFLQVLPYRKTTFVPRKNQSDAVKFLSMRPFPVVPALNLLQSLLQESAAFLFLLRKLEFEYPATMSGVHLKIASTVRTVHFCDRQHGPSDKKSLYKSAAHGLVRRRKPQVIHRIEGQIEITDDVVHRAFPQG